MKKLHIKENIEENSKENKSIKYNTNIQQKPI